VFRGVRKMRWQRYAAFGGREKGHAASPDGELMVFRSGFADHAQPEPWRLGATGRFSSPFSWPATRVATGRQVSLSARSRPGVFVLSSRKFSKIL
jgi:hypothetical protein